MNIDNDSITKVDVNHWDRPLSIDTNHRALIAARPSTHPGNIEVMVDCVCQRACTEQQKKGLEK